MVLLFLLPFTLLVNSVSSFLSQNDFSERLLHKASGCISHHPTLIFSTINPLQDEQKQSKELHECQGCNGVFKSRNALFRHLRGDDEASIECSLAMGVDAASEDELLMTTAVRYGYYFDTLEGNANELVANLIHRAFLHHTNTFLDGGKTENVTISTSALTYSTATKLRRPSLRQDKEVVGSTSEVLSFNYRLSGKPMAIKKWKDYASSCDLQEHMQAWLDEEDCGIQIQLHHMDALVPRSSKFYAERGCSQRGYRYLLPIRWLLPGIAGNGDATKFDDMNITQVTEWWNHISSESTPHRQHEPRGHGNAMTESPGFIRSLKRSLKALESQTVQNRRTRREAERNNDDDSINADSKITNNDSIRLSPGRFGQLWRKQRQCWSNFCHPELSGMAASPGHEAVWRTMDRAKIVGFVNSNNSVHDEDQDHRSKEDMSLNDTFENAHVILDFRADGFVMGQIPRVISSLVAMTNGWLPETFFDIATSPDVFMPAPPAPPELDSRLYFHSARYHFHELTGNTHLNNSGNNFSATVRTGTQSEQSWEAELRKKLLEQASLINDRKDEVWLQELRDVISPNLRQQINEIETATIEEQSSSDTTLPLVDTDAPAGAYSDTLELLRQVVEDGKWPSTSDARSRVIKSPIGSSESIIATKKQLLASAFPGNTQNISSGSFTVVNEEIWNDAKPLGNKLFPDLTQAVFELERSIIRETCPPLPAADGMKRLSSSSLHRTPSTHCAVNRNAQFTPHVDSGRGRGQSVSMIVGLGNYTGGEIFVDGTPYDIRYNALEFDGWKQLHWTSPFKGERFSLVWFSPDVSPNDGNRVEQGKKHSNLDDELANCLAKEHSKKIPLLPSLRFRPDSTDAVVINELLDQEKSAYTMKPNTYMPSGFSLKNHQCVLDVGAHIGVFSRLAIYEGCQHVIAYEPEPSNFELLKQNLMISHEMPSPLPTIELHSSAVAQGSSKSRTLVKARHENNGRQNTWRHCLEEYSQYEDVDKSTKLPSKSQKKTLERFSVKCASFFGSDDGKEKGVIVPGVTFVKLDCEGAEVDILLSKQASHRSSWLDTTHLVVEYSLTKERRVNIFHKAISNLRQAGFEVYYEGIGSWWDTDEGVMWPYPNDLIVFAIMKD